MTRMAGIGVFVLVGVLPGLRAQTPDQVLIVVNKQSGSSKTIGEYYARKRKVPVANICVIDANPSEHTTREAYISDIEKPIGNCLVSARLQEQILYIVTTLGVPLLIEGDSKGTASTTASVDSELILLYRKLKGETFQTRGALYNGFYGQIKAKFQHPQFGMYLVNRLAAYDLEDVKRMIDKALVAKRAGNVVIDQKFLDQTDGDKWLGEAADRLPRDHVILDKSIGVLKALGDVIAYASWGSNDRARNDRNLGFRWLPGAIVSEYVSTNARTFIKPPEGWRLGKNYSGSQQSLLADYLHEGATGGGGHVDEPYLNFIARPEILLPAYYSGRNLAESFWMATPAVSWMNIVIGDPLCRLQ